MKFNVDAHIAADLKNTVQFYRLPIRLFVILSI